MEQQRFRSLDVIRGAAILLICIINVPEGMGSTTLTHIGNVKLSGWSPADAATWWFLHAFVEGTQRGLLQLLLGASIVLLAGNAHAAGISPTRALVSRYGSLALFGIFDIALIGWYGDILLEYSLATLAAAFLRNLRAPVLILIGSAYIVWTCAAGPVPHPPPSAGAAAPAVAVTRVEPAAEPGAIVIPRVTPMSQRSDPAIASFIATEAGAHLGGPRTYLDWARRFWRTLVLPNLFIPSVIGSFFTILIGMGLFKLGFLQGALPTRVYAATLILGLAMGIAIRVPGSNAIAFDHQGPFIVPATAAEIGRLSLALAYAAGLILLLRSPVRRALHPLAAPGRMAFSLYLFQNFCFIFLVFNGGGLALFGRFSWFALTMIALSSLPLQVMLATAWLSLFRMGPLEWLWRSIAQRRFMPFERQPAAFGG